MLSGMSDKRFEIGEDVKADGIRGNVIEYRELPSGTLLVGIIDGNGRVKYFAEQAVQSSEGMVGYPIVLRF